MPLVDIYLLVVETSVVHIFRYVVPPLACPQRQQKNCERAENSVRLPELRTPLDYEIK